MQGEQSRALSAWSMVSAHNGSYVEGEAGSRERFALSLKLARQMGSALS